VGAYTLSSSATMPAPFDCAAIIPHTIGATTAGSLGQGDCRDPVGGGLADYYELTLSSAGPVSITLQPGSGTMIVVLTDEREQFLSFAPATAGATATVGGNLAPGRYIVIVVAPTPGQTGSYSLTSSPTLPPPPPPPHPFLGCDASQAHAIGAMVNGRLDASDCVAVTGHFLDRHEFTLSEVRTVTVDLRADFDAFLYLFDASGAIIAENDDWSGLDSRISITLPPGTYSLGASSYHPGATGSYTLSSM